MTYTDPAKRHEFVLLFDATNSNPNGDPDAGNLPRVDPETMHGLVTDVCLKRKVRNYAQAASNGKAGYGIFIQSQTALNTLKQQSAEQLQPELSKEERAGKRVITRLRERLCQDYYDIRMFGAVLATGEAGDRLNAGQVRGPAQFSFARSVDPVHAMDCAITRQARTTEERMETGETEMGRKGVVPYGLYRGHGFFNPLLATDTQVKEDDLKLLWEAIEHLFDLDRSAARPEMSIRGLYVFTHDAPIGNAPAHILFETVHVERKPEVEAPRSFKDYVVTIDEGSVPKGVTLTRLVG